jgi:hypothetical protein
MKASLSLVVMFGMVAGTLASPVTPRLPTINKRQVGKSVASVGPCTVSDPTAELCLAVEYETNIAKDKLLE